jgi:signal transduction histidine kinase
LAIGWLILRQPIVKLRNSLAGRLIAGAALWTVALLIAGAFVLTTQYRQSVHRVDDDRLNAVIESLAAFLEVSPDGKFYLSRTPGDPRFERVFSGQYWQIFPVSEKAKLSQAVHSESLFDSDLSVPKTVIEQAKKQAGSNIKADLTGPDNEPLRSLTRVVQLADQVSVLAITAAADRRPGDKEIARFRMLVAWTLGLFALGLVVAVIIQVRIGLSPIYKIRKAIALVREGEAEKVEGDYPAELMPLAEELNHLLGHNKEVVERARTHVGNLAHALKTPISILLNETRKNQPGLEQLVQKQTVAMSRQVDHHLHRASAAARAQVLGARTPVSEAVSDIRRTLERLFKDKHIQFETKVSTGLVFRGERQDLDELLGNLMENACKWSNGIVRVRAERSSSTTLDISVEDNGEGLPAKKRKTVVARGERLDESAPGSGLGLSIVSDLAGAYGGEFWLEDSPLGGLKAVLRLPSANSTE